ncbi:MAG: hypothetical protein AAB478_00710 [Patescibacteria group bacterium]
MPATNLSFAKVVATPTATSWSQAYNAGSLFIALSLVTSNEELQENLPTIGKQILSNVEAEFFGLEDKTFESITTAVNQAIRDIPEGIELSLCLAYIKDDTLYAFVVGTGRITLKRGEKIGTIVSHLQDKTTRTVQSASGYLQTDDLVMLQTTQFVESVPQKTLAQAFEYTLPSDIAETISPLVHGEEEGGSAAIILVFNGISRAVSEDLLEETASPHPSEPPIIHQPPILEQNIEEKTQSPLSYEEGTDTGDRPSLKARLPKITLPHLQIPRQKKLVGGLAILLLGLLIVSIIFIQRQQATSKEKALFQEIYTSAKKDFDEGEGLLSLNKSLARDDYKSAKDTLVKSHGQFKPDSKEEQQLTDLESQVDERLEQTEGSSSVTAKEISGTDAPLLQTLSKDSTLRSATEDEDNIYTISSKTIASITKSGSKKEDVVKNDSDWSDPKSLGVFSGNLYVLDPKEGLLKFVPTSTGEYASSTYFKGDTPDLKDAVSMAIDGSIYILFSDGSIKKYTKGTEESFSVSGLTDDFTSPLAIFTSSDIDNLYVLDPSKNRIVKLDKSGTFVAQYQASILKDTKAFTISTDEKSAFVLAGGKIYELGL